MSYVETSNGIYSVKWINPSYTGPIFNFRRSSDNVTLDFYVSGDGNSIGTSLAGTGTTLSSWLGGSTAYVAKWYDQSTLGNHATQTTNSAQPTYDITNKCVNFNSTNSNRFILPNGTVPFNNTNYTVVVKHGTLSSNSAFLSSGVPLANQANIFGLLGTTYINYWWASDFAQGPYAANNTVTWKYDGSTRYVYINGSVFTSAASSGRTSTSANNYIGFGETVNNFYANGQVYNIFIYTTALSDANRLSAESNAGVTSEYPCFLQGSKILRFNPDTYQEEYTPIEKLRTGDLIPTAESGYKSIHAIGYRTIPFPKSDTNPSNRLYTFNKSTCPEVFEPLHLTGEHCTLHRNISADKRDLITEHMGDVYITEEFYRMPACLDDRAKPYEGSDEPATIWHFALENEQDTYNYGVYANGLLVESSSIRSLLEKSGMNLICSSESYETK